MKQHSTIRVLGAEIYARHGVGEAERAIGGRYSFDLEIDADITAAAANDDLHETVDYERAYFLAREILLGTHRRLLESLVDEIAEALLDRFANATGVTVRLRKLSVPIDGVVRAVEVELRRERDGASE
jgi:dihydroneopterin aldolase